MTKSSLTSETAPTLLHPAGIAETADALAVLGAAVQMQEIYQDLLQQLIFDTVTISDRKSARRYQRTLSAQPALNVLMFIWKDSESVSGPALDMMGLERFGTDSEPINCHALAKEIAEDVADFERQHKHIQAVVAAAEAYGLVERTPHGTSRRQILCGTAQLHRLMVALGADLRPIYAEAALGGGGLK